MTESKIAVIGGGIIGVCSALWLQREGANVVIIEVDEIGMGASFGNAGCFNPSSVVPVSMPGALLKVPRYLIDPNGPLVIHPAYLPHIVPWLWRFVRAGRKGRVTEQAAALRSMLHDSYDAYQPLVRGTVVAEVMKREGHLITYRTEADYAGDALGWKLRRQNGVLYEELRGPALREREPAISPNIAIGLFLPMNGHTVDPYQFIKGLSEIFFAGGGERLKARATGFEIDGQVLKAVLTTDGRLAASKAVIACGAHSLCLTKGLGDVIPLDTERGYHVMIRNPEVMPRVPITDASGKFVISPMREGLRVAGAIEFAGLHREPNYQRARMLVPQARNLLPGLSVNYPNDRLSVWMGRRPSIPDSLPVIGRSQRSADIVYAFGHGHVGMAGGSRTGMLVRDLVLGLPNTMPADPFSPRRF